MVRVDWERSVGAIGGWEVGLDWIGFEWRLLEWIVECRVQSDVVV